MGRLGNERHFVKRHLIGRRQFANDVKSATFYI